MTLSAASLRPSQQRAQTRRSERKQAMLAKMSPAQRVQALKQESAFKAGQKTKRENQILRTTAGGQGLREQQRGIQRERALAAMTPEQREQTLKQESEFKASQAAKQDQQEKAKALRTVAKVGNKEEREKFRATKRSAQREQALAAMTPEQREQALKQEADAQAAEAAREAAAQKEKLRRQVAMVGDKAEREKNRADKQALRREDMLGAAAPDEREAMLKQEAAFKAAQAAQQERAAKAKAARTVAIVGDEKARDAFGPPRGTPTRYQAAGVDLSRSMMTAELSLLASEVALLS